MKLDIKKDLSVHISLMDYGYLHFEPLYKVNEDQTWAIRFKVTDGMRISYLMQKATNLTFEEIFKLNSRIAIDNMIKSLKNIQELLE